MALAGQVGVKFVGEYAEYTKATDKVQRANGDVGVSMKQLEREAESVRKSIATPMEAYEQQAAKIQKLEERGLLTAKEAARAREKINADLAKSQGGNSFLASLKSFKEGLEKSGFMTLLETLKGGAVFAGAAFVLDSIGKAAREAAVAITEYKQGTIDAGQATLKVAESIPLLGRFFAAAKGIAELIDAAANGPVMRVTLLDPEEAKAAQRNAAAVVLGFRQMIEAANEFYATRGRRGVFGDLAAARAGFAAESREIEQAAADVRNREASKELGPAEAIIAYEAVITRAKVARDKFIDETKNAVIVAGGRVAGGVGQIIESAFTTKFDKAMDFFRRIGDATAKVRSAEREVAQVAMERMRAQGAIGELAAQEAAIREQIAERELSLRRIMNDPAAGDAARRAAASEYEKLGQTRADLEARAALAGRELVLGKEQLLNAMMIERLQAAAALGNTEAGVAARRLQVEDQIRAKRLALEKELADQTLPKSIQKRIREELDALPALQAMLQAAVSGANVQHASVSPQLSANFTTNNRDYSAEILRANNQANTYLRTISEKAAEKPKVVSFD